MVGVDRVAVPLIVTLEVAPLTAEPMLMVVVEPDTPAVPMLIVFVVAFAVAPVPKLRVCAAVDCPTVIAPVPAVPPATIVPVVCPAFSEILVVVPVVVTVEFALNVVNVPAAAVVPPIAGGEAR